MPWTAPRTWVDGETATAALLNVHLRDNLRYAHGTTCPRVKVSTSGQTLGATTSMDWTTADYDPLTMWAGSGNEEITVPSGADGLWFCGGTLKWASMTATIPRDWLALEVGGIDGAGTLYGLDRSDQSLIADAGDYSPLQRSCSDLLDLNAAQTVALTAAGATAVAGASMWCRWGAATP